MSLGPLPWLLGVAAGNTLALLSSVSPYAIPMACWGSVETGQFSEVTDMASILRPESPTLRKPKGTELGAQPAIRRR